MFKIFGLVTSKWCCKNINSGQFDFKSVLAEMEELVEATTWRDIKEEFGDVLYFLYCWLYSNLRINLPMIGAMGSVRKFTARLEIWEEIFDNQDLKFHLKYLVNGSNYEKIEKVHLALDMARKEQRNGTID